MNAPFFMNRVLFGQSNLIENGGGLSALNSYMLTPDNFLKVDDVPNSIEEDSNKMLVEEPPPKTSVVQSTPAKNTRYIPRDKDSIFWCIYTAINGPNMTHNTTNVMMNEKKAMSDYFNKNPTILKNINHRVTLAKINEIKCNLMTKPFMDSIESFIPCSIYYKRPIYVLFEEIDAYYFFKDNTYVSDDEDDDDESILIYANARRFSLETCKTKTSNFIRNCMTTYMYLQDCDRVLSGISNYKVDELKKYYNIVFKRRDGDGDIGLNKTQYYERILLKCYTTVKGTNV